MTLYRTIREEIVPFPEAGAPRMMARKIWERSADIFFSSCTYLQINDESRYFDF